MYHKSRQKNLQVSKLFLYYIILSKIEKTLNIFDDFIDHQFFYTIINIICII